MSSERHPIVGRFHRHEAVGESEIARALNIAAADRRSGDLTSLLHRFGNQNFEFATMSFRDFREIYRAIELGPADLFCDAGAGYGHAVIYGACVADCRFRAVEILPARCSAMRKTAQRLGLRHLDIVQGDALAQDYADVTHLFLNNPFFPGAAERFVARLKASRKHALTVVAVHNIVDTFRNDCDFREIDVDADLPNYCFGVFRWKPRKARAG
jgi:precorrin-6B methylase 2